MTLQELKDSRSNVLGAELTGDDLMSLEEGTVLFGGTVANGTKPQLERAVIISGFRYVANVDHGLGVVDCLGLTKNGYAAIYTNSKSDLDTNHFLFKVQMPGPDYRSLLRDAILVLIQTELIHIEARIKMRPEISAFVKAISVFTDEEFLLTTYQDDWNDGPCAASADCIISALENGDLKFKHYDEWGRECH